MTRKGNPSNVKAMMKRLQDIIIWTIGIIAVLLSVRAVFNPSFFPLHDFTHVARLVEMDTAIKDGHIPVRWSRDLGYGYGMPLFNFYGPLPFYIAEAWYMLGFSAITSIKVLLIIIGLMGYAGMYKLASRWFGRTGGLLAAVAFTVIPYRAVDIFVRGAFNEAFAISSVPWILYFIDDLRRKVSLKSICLLSLSLFGLFTSHNLMTIIFMPLIYGFVLLETYFSKNKKRYLIAVHVGLLIAVMLSSFYLFPAYFEKGYTQVDKLISGYGRYVFHFLYIRQFFTGKWGYGGSIPWPYAGMSFQIGWVHIILVTLGGVALLLRKKIKDFALLSFFTASTGIALFMTLYKAQFIWDRIPMLAYVQFPWRFLSVICVTIPFLVGAAVLLIKRRSQRILLTLIAVIVLLAYNLQYYTPKEFLDNPEALYYTDQIRIQKDMSGILPDYIPTTVKSLPPQGKKRIEVENAKIPGKFEIRSDKTQEMLVYIQDGNPSDILFRVFWFPGWNVYIDGVKSSYEIDSDTGFLRVHVPKGEHFVSVIFEDTPLRLASNAVSFIGLVIWMGMFFYDRHTRNSA